MFGLNDYVEKIMAAQKLGYLLDLDVQDVLAIYRPWRYKSTCGCTFASAMWCSPGPHWNVWMQLLVWIGMEILCEASSYDVGPAGWDRCTRL